MQRATLVGGPDDGLVISVDSEKTQCRVRHQSKNSRIAKDFIYHRPTALDIRFYLVGVEVISGEKTLKSVWLCANGAWRTIIDDERTPNPWLTHPGRTSRSES